MLCPYSCAYHLFQKLHVLRRGICEGQAAVAYIQARQPQGGFDGDGIDFAE